jgi:hypothetical protein
MAFRYDGSVWRPVSSVSPGEIEALALKENLGEISGVETVADADYTLVLADKGKVKEGTSSSARTFTIPPNASVAFPVSTVVNIAQIGTGQITIAPGSGVTIRSPNGLKISAQYGVATLYKRGTNEWVISGSITT